MQKKKTKGIRSRSITYTKKCKSPIHIQNHIYSSKKHLESQKSQTIQNKPTLHLR